MAERPEQVAFSHLVLDALMDGSIALCDAGTGIGRTCAYLAAGATFHRFRTDQGRHFCPILISASSIALQNTIQMEYLPILSNALTADGLLSLRDRLDMDGVFHLSSFDREARLRSPSL